MSVRPVEMHLRAGWNGFAGRIWPAGRSLETPALYESSRVAPGACKRGWAPQSADHSWHSRKETKSGHNETQL